MERFDSVRFLWVCSIVMYSFNSWFKVHKNCTKWKIACPGNFCVLDLEEHVTDSRQVNSFEGSECDKEFQVLLNMVAD